MTRFKPRTSGSEATTLPTEPQPLPYSPISLPHKLAATSDLCQGRLGLKYVDALASFLLTSKRYFVFSDQIVKMSDQEDSAPMNASSSSSTMDLDNW